MIFSKVIGDQPNNPGIFFCQDLNITCKISTSSNLPKIYGLLEKNSAWLPGLKKKHISQFKWLLVAAKNPTESVKNSPLELEARRGSSLSSRPRRPLLLTPHHCEEKYLLDQILWCQTRTRRQTHWSGQIIIIIFHQPRFPWNFRDPISLPKSYLVTRLMD